MGEKFVEKTIVSENAGHDAEKNFLLHQIHAPSMKPNARHF